MRAVARPKQPVMFYNLLYAENDMLTCDRAALKRRYQDTGSLYSSSPDVKPTPPVVSEPTKPVESVPSEPVATSSTQSVLVEPRPILLHKTDAAPTYVRSEEDDVLIKKWFEKESDTWYTCRACTAIFANRGDNALLCHLSMSHDPEDIEFHPKEYKPLLLINPDTIGAEKERDTSKLVRCSVRRWECCLCDKSFANSSYPWKHMKSEHTLFYYNLKPNTGERVNCLTEDQKKAKLKALNYNPTASTKHFTIKYDDSDPDKITCDFFEPDCAKLQCLICDWKIRATNKVLITHHLRREHKIRILNRAEILGSPTETSTPMEQDTQESDVAANCDDTSLNGVDKDKAAVDEAGSATPQKIEHVVSNLDNKMVEVEDADQSI